MKSAHLWIAAVLLICSGCSQKPAAAPASADFFTGWLRSHGESNVVVDAGGVGLAGNPTRLSYSVYGSQQATNDTASVELEFRIHIPDGRDILEYVAGTGRSVEKAENDAKINFVLSTFHVVYRSFLNTNDPHQLENDIVIDGQPRKLLLGDTMTRGEGTNNAPDMFLFRDKFREMLKTVSLSPGPHWLKIVYANHQAKSMLCAVTLDNQDAPELTTTVTQLPWPKTESFYMVKQFVVIK